jgi:hypothetical protein
MAQPISERAVQKQQAGSLPLTYLGGGGLVPHVTFAPSQHRGVHGNAQSLVPRPVQMACAVR